MIKFTLKNNLIEDSKFADLINQGNKLLEQNCIIQRLIEKVAKIFGMDPPTEKYLGELIDTVNNLSKSEGTEELKLAKLQIISQIYYYCAQHAGYDTAAVKDFSKKTSSLIENKEFEAVSLTTPSHSEKEAVQDSLPKNENGLRNSQPVFTQKPAETPTPPVVQPTVAQESADNVNETVAPGQTPVNDQIQPEPSINSTVVPESTQDPANNVNETVTPEQTPVNDQIQPQLGINPIVVPESTQESAENVNEMVAPGQTPVNNQIQPQPSINSTVVQDSTQEFANNVNEMVAPGQTHVIDKSQPQLGINPTVVPDSAQDPANNVNEMIAPGQTPVIDKSQPQLGINSTIVPASTQDPSKERSETTKPTVVLPAGVAQESDKLEPKQKEKTLNQSTGVTTKPSPKPEVKNKSWLPFFKSKPNLPLDMQNSIKEGNVSELKRLISQKVGINTPLPNGEKPLHFAVRCNQQEVVETLIEKGVDVTAKDFQELTALEHAILMKNESMLACILGKKIKRELEEVENQIHSKGSLKQAQQLKYTITEITSVNINNLLAMSKAAYRGDLNELAELENSTINELDGGLAPIHYAILGKQYTAIDKLIELGANVTNLDTEENNLLHYAVMSDSLALVKKLTELKVDPNHQNQDGYTPLHYAAVQGNLKLMKALIAAGADPSILSKSNFSPLGLIGWDAHQKDPLATSKIQLGLLMMSAFVGLAQLAVSRGWVDDKDEQVAHVIYTLNASQFLIELGIALGLKGCWNDLTENTFRNVLLIAAKAASIYVPPIDVVFQGAMAYTFRPSLEKVKACWNNLGYRNKDVAKEVSIYGLNQVHAGWKVYQSSAQAYQWSQNILYNGVRYVSYAALGFSTYSYVKSKLGVFGHLLPI